MRRPFLLLLLLASLAPLLVACTGGAPTNPGPSPTAVVSTSYEPSPIPAQDSPEFEASGNGAQPEQDQGLATPAPRGHGEKNSIPGCIRPTALQTGSGPAHASTPTVSVRLGHAAPDGIKPASIYLNTSAGVSTGRPVHLPILVYHHIQIIPATATAILRGLSVAPIEFDKQMAYLASHNYHTISFSDLIAYFRDGQPLPENPIILTFDDGWEAQYTVAFPILRKYCLAGTFFPPTNWVDRTTGTVLTWSQIAEMSANGMEFGSHTVTHYLMAQRTDAENRYELITSKRLIEQRTIRPVVALAYPGGSFNANVVKLLPETGYGAAVSMLGGVEQSYSEIYSLRRTSIRYWDTVESFAQKLR